MPHKTNHRRAAEEQRSRKPKSDKYKLPHAGFVDVSLTQEQKDTLKDELMSYDEAMSFVEACLLESFKMTLTYTPKQHLATASLIDKDPDSPSAGKCLTARAPHIIGALTLLQFKHVVVLDAQWERAAEIPQKPVWD